nr:MAG TPA: hypothetical protein [Caudoviricetes sp.]
MLFQFCNVQPHRAGEPLLLCNLRGNGGFEPPSSLKLIT